MLVGENEEKTRMIHVGEFAQRRSPHLRSHKNSFSFENMKIVHEPENQLNNLLAVACYIFIFCVKPPSWINNENC